VANIPWFGTESVAKYCAIIHVIGLGTD